MTMIQVSCIMSSSCPVFVQADPNPNLHPPALRKSATPGCEKAGALLLTTAVHAPQKTWQGTELCWWRTSESCIQTYHTASGGGHRSTTQLCSQMHPLPCILARHQLLRAAA
jgi:hypothetical protein